MKCIHCGEPRTAHGRFARCSQGKNQYEDVIPQEMLNFSIDRAMDELNFEPLNQEVAYALSASGAQWAEPLSKVWPTLEHKIKTAIIAAWESRPKTPPIIAYEKDVRAYLDKFGPLTLEQHQDAIEEAVKKLVIALLLRNKVEIARGCVGLIYAAVGLAIMQNRASITEDTEHAMLSEYKQLSNIQQAEHILAACRVSTPTEIACRVLGVSVMQELPLQEIWDGAHAENMIGGPTTTRSLRDDRPEPEGEASNLVTPTSNPHEPKTGSKTIKSLVVREDLREDRVGLYLYFTEPSTSDGLGFVLHKGDTIEDTATYLETVAEELRKMDNEPV